MARISRSSRIDRQINFLDLVLEIAGQCNRNRGAMIASSVKMPADEDRSRYR
jgi:hypothetical protein